MDSRYFIDDYEALLCQKLEIRQLECFQASVCHRTFTGAAIERGLPPNLFAIDIRKLEKSLGVRLFRRSKTISLTKEGEIFLRSVTPALQHLRQAMDEMREYREFRKGKVRFGIAPLLDLNFMLPCISAFQAVFPQLDLSLAEDAPPFIFRRVDDGDLDFGVMALDDAPPAMEIMPIAACRIHAFIPAGHPLARKKAISYHELEWERLILPKDDCLVRRRIVDSFRQCGVEPNVVIESSQLTTIKALVRSGAGIACLLAPVGGKDESRLAEGQTESRPVEGRDVEQEEAGLVAVPLEGPPLKIAVIWSANRALSTAARAFIDFCHGRNL